MKITGHNFFTTSVIARGVLYILCYTTTAPSAPIYFLLKFICIHHHTYDIINELLGWTRVLIWYQPGFSLRLPQKWGFGWGGASSDPKTVIYKDSTLNKLVGYSLTPNPGGCIPSL